MFGRFSAQRLVKNEVRDLPPPPMPAPTTITSQTVRSASRASSSPLAKSNSSANCGSKLCSVEHERSIRNNRPVEFFRPKTDDRCT